MFLLTATNFTKDLFSVSLCKYKYFFIFDISESLFYPLLPVSKSNCQNSIVVLLSFSFLFNINPTHNTTYQITHFHIGVKRNISKHHDWPLVAKYRCLLERLAHPCFRRPLSHIWVCWLYVCWFILQIRLAELNSEYLGKST